MFFLSQTFVPLFWYQIVAFGFGVIIGSFLNVYIYRFNTGKSLNGRSHCLSCGTNLHGYELVPLLSYVVLRGRCRTCSSRIPVRYLLVELLTGLLFAATPFLSLDVVHIGLLWWIFSLLIVLVVYDLYHFIIPDRLVLILTAVVGTQRVYDVYQVSLYSWGSVLTDIFVALLGVGFFLFLWLVSKGRWIGFGDVKLAFPLGVLVGWESVFSFVVLSFWIGAAISVLWMGVLWFGRGKARLHLPFRNLTMKSAVPFAPFLVASSVVILFTHFNVLELFTF